MTINSGFSAPCGLYCDVCAIYMAHRDNNQKLKERLVGLYRIKNFPMTVGKKVIFRAIPHWREVGTEKWIQDEEARYVCPECGN